MSGADGDALTVENGSDVVGMRVFEHERNDGRLFLGSPDDTQALDLEETLGCVKEQ